LDKNVRAPKKGELPTTQCKWESAIYTPAFINRYIVGQALGGVLKQRFEALRQQHEAEATGTARKALADPNAYDLNALNEPQLRGLHPCRLSGRHHPAYPGQGRPNGSLLRLVQQQNAWGAPARLADGIGGPPPGRFPATAGKTRVKAVAGSHSPGLASGPPALPCLSEPNARCRGH
jgi:hypothetical protein